ncbi:hypothetical protein DYB32_010078 [Aphanomyces invadans]|uniref:tryptophan--tRNA ligase n=1 Tax=Aphanomyces invadans TaxID=157072 RepID=A0A418AGX4_9STRA|nr:hypothetical protein DYB32_010078 [Aphanomyces invadans]
MIIPQPSAYEFPPFADDGDLLAFMDGTLFPPTKSSHDDMAVASCPSSPRSAHTTDLDTSDDCAHDHHFPMEKGERRKQQIRDASRRCRIKQRAEVMNLRTRVAELEARVATGIKLQRDHDMRLRQIELLEGEIARLRNELRVPHLGNYCGAVSKWVSLQQQSHGGADADLSLYSIVDLHAITLPYKPSKLQANIHGLLASLLGCGLDPKKSILFKQSDVAQHTELAWLLSCITPLSWMQRMTQFKQKSQQKDSNAVSLGYSCKPFDSRMTPFIHRLLSYPALMAADVLLYKATHVPVGDDQQQHLELARMIATTFNDRFQTNLFPKPIPQRGISFVDLWFRRVNVSISYDKAARPGVSNLMSILSAVTGQSLEDIQTQYGVHMPFFPLLLTKAGVDSPNWIGPIGHRIQTYQADPAYLNDLLRDGRDSAAAIAASTMVEVKAAMGL